MDTILPWVLSSLILELSSAKGLVQELITNDQVFFENKRAMLGAQAFESKYPFIYK